MTAAREFRIRLRKPKRTLWLGCEIKAVRSFTRHLGVNLSFTNCPFFASLGKVDGRHWLVLCHTYNLEDVFLADILVPGRQVHVDVRWDETMQDGITLIRPYGKILLRALAEDVANGR